MSELEELRLYKQEHERLKKRLNKALHPKGDAPESPTFGDLVKYAEDDLKKLRIALAECAYTRKGCLPISAMGLLSQQDLFVGRASIDALEKQEVIARINCEKITVKDCELDLPEAIKVIGIIITDYTVGIERKYDQDYVDKCFKLVEAAALYGYY